MSDRKLDLVLFRAFAGAKTACFSGRVMFRAQLVGVQRSERLRGRLKDAWRMLISRRVPRAQIAIRLGDETWHTTTDRHGYFFTCQAHHAHRNPNDLWLKYTCTATHPDCAEPIEGRSELLTATTAARHLIISDIDDTIIHTGVANKLKMLWRLYFASGEDRRPFPGMDGLLRGLHGGGNGVARNPMLYVSRSPWSIYPLLEDFFNRHDIPVGPVLLLRDWGISLRHPLPRRAADHKTRMIDSVMQAFPNLPAVLIGDSGQHDPEVYADVVRRHPDRVSAVYIRDLSLSPQRSEELNDMRELLAAEGVDFVVSNDTQGFATHATERSLMPSIRGPLEANDKPVET